VTVPRVIHQIWLGGEPPAQVATWLESWAVRHPGWEHRLWVDGDVPALQNQALFDAAPTYAMKADVLRLELLQQEGGVYVDADYECHRSVDRLVEGVELALLSEGPVLTNSFIAASPGHGLITALVRGLGDVDIRAVRSGRADVSSTTGPRYLTRTASRADWMTRPAVRILPPDYFLVPHTRDPEVLRWAEARRFATHHAMATWTRRSVSSHLRSTHLRRRLRRFVHLDAV
jgi:mannosyltransferase OCH1-like enzyme